MQHLHGKDFTIYACVADRNNKSAEEVDVFAGGFPCQPFSKAGLQKAFKDRRGIVFFEMVRYIKAKRPRLILLENVKGLVIMFVAEFKDINEYHTARKF